MRADALPDSTDQTGENDAAAHPPSLEREIAAYYDREHLSLRRYLLFEGLDTATAEEIVQETFLRLFQHLQQSKSQTNLRAWLFRVARNLARNEHNSARRKRQADWNTADIQPSTHSPEADMLARERDRQLHSALLRLTEAERSCLLLRAEGMRYREIASVLDLSLSTVAENVARALARLKGLL